MNNQHTLAPIISLVELLSKQDDLKQLERLYNTERLKGIVEYPLTINYLAQAADLLKNGSMIDIPREEYESIKSYFSNFDATLTPPLIDTFCVVILSIWREILDSRLQDEPSGMYGARTSPDLKIYRKWAGHLYDNLVQLPEVRTRKRCTDLIALIFSSANPERHLNKYKNSPPVTEFLDAKGGRKLIEVPLQEYLYKRTKKLIAEHFEIQSGNKIQQ